MLAQGMNVWQHSVSRLLPNRPDRLLWGSHKLQTGGEGGGYQTDVTHGATHPKWLRYDSGSHRGFDLNHFYASCMQFI